MSASQNRQKEAGLSSQEIESKNKTEKEKK